MAKAFLLVAVIAGSALAGCLDNGATGSEAVRLELTTGYDARSSPDRYREWGFEEGRPAAGADVIVKLFDPAAFPRGPPPRAVGHDPNAGEPNQTESGTAEPPAEAPDGRADEPADADGKRFTRVQRGDSISIPEGNASHEFMVELDEAGRAVLFVDTNGTISIALRVLRGPLESTDACERQYFDSQPTLVDPLDGDRTVHVPYGISCRQGSA